MDTFNYIKEEGCILINNYQKIINSTKIYYIAQCGHERNTLFKILKKGMGHQLRKLVLEYDGYQCVRCGKSVDEAELHCHHIDPVKNNPIESADVDNCITLCIYHHKETHQQKGCGYKDLSQC